MKTKIHFILGQTATGKTGRAASLARELGGELINCDSRQVYKYLNIITGKTDNPTDVKVHCVDLVDPKESYSAYDYAANAYNETLRMITRSVPPIVIGGTGMYAYLLKYFDPDKVPIMTKAPRYFDSFTLVELQEKISSEYKFIWNELNESDRKNKRRLSAALQRLLYGNSQTVNFDAINNLANSHKLRETILLYKDESSLEMRLRTRISDRLKLGAICECENLLAAGYKSTDPGLVTIGYQSIFSYLQGRITEKAMLDEWFTRERQYAKRQKTYLLKYFPDAKIIYV